SATGTVESGFSNDVEGRLTAQTGIGAKTLTWDAKSRLKTLTKNSITQTYGYDPMDYRIRHSNAANGQLDYYLEGEHLESVEQNGYLTEKYFRGISTDELIAAYLIDTDGKSKPYQFHHDNLTSTTQVTGHNGGTLQSITYSAFGASINTTGTSPNRLKYTGREDDGTGLYYYRARYYDTNIGRFISEDPLQFQAGINFYEYVNNNPVNANDPSGKCPSCVGALTSVALGGAIRYATSGGDWNAVFDGGAIALDAGLGAVGAGLANKLSTINQLSKIEQLAVPGSRLGQIGESLAGISSKGKSAIESISNTAVRRFPDLNLGNITEVKNVARISSRDAAQIYDSILFDQARGTTTSLLTRGVSTNISLVQSFVDDGLLNVGKIPGINSSGVANLSTGMSSSIGFGFGSINYLSGSSSANGGFLLYPNKPNNNQMQSVYSK
ncbi:MAG: RHS repeat-associated core domain-containing protein, partial [Methylococcales bacterium]|nr:RHS repeat-associated core domain-containing protein [Methylococcales bacterium]